MPGDPFVDLKISVNCRTKNQSSRKLGYQIKSSDRMNGFQVGSDVTVNPDCVAPIRGGLRNDVLFPVCVRCSRHQAAAGVRSVLSIRELG